MALIMECSRADLGAEVSVHNDLRALGQRLAAGDENAFEQVVRHFEGDVGRLARRLLGFRGGNDADDVVQEVFVKVYLKRRSFRGASSLRTWLMHVTVNCVRSMQRRRILRLEMLWRSKPPQSACVDEGAIISERGRQAREAVARLTGKDREAVVLHYLEEMPVGLVAEIMGTSEGSVMVRLHRARKKLADMLRGPNDE